MYKKCWQMFRIVTYKSTLRAFYLRQIEINFFHNLVLLHSGFFYMIESSKICGGLFSFMFVDILPRER